jgi:hypothetical protein
MRIAIRSLLVIAGLVAVIVIAARMQPDDAPGPCVVTAVTELSDLLEASGLAVSGRVPGLLWTHNDSGNAPVLFALDSSGALRGRVHVPVRTRDWEDVSAGRCASGSCLYVADIGDNLRKRQSVRIFRVPEPVPGAVATATPEVFTVVYADGAHNAEALFVVGDELFIVSKDRTGGLYRSTRPFPASRNLTFERIGELDMPFVTDAETSPDGASVVVRTTDVAAIFRTADLLRGGTVRPETRIALDGLREPQGEGAALGPNGALYLTSEGRAGRFTSLRCTLTPSAAAGVSLSAAPRPR